MDKNYEENPEKSKYIKENLQSRYPEIFEYYEMDDLSQIQVCNLAEFLLAEHPEKYEKNRVIYETDEDLKRIYAVISKEKDFAVMINTNQEGKVPEGEFGTYDLQKNRFRSSNEIKKEVVEYLGIDALQIKEQDEIVDSIFKDLNDMDKLATMDLSKIIEEKRPQINQLVDDKIDKTNEKNGKSKEEREKIEKSEKAEDKKNNIIVEQENNGQDENNKIPKDVAEACQKIGVTKIKGYFYVNALDLNNKVDNTLVNKNGEKVLMLEVESDKVDGPNKYYGMQKQRMVLYGNENEAVRDVTGKVTKMGKVVEPLKMQEPKTIEYQDSNGLVINETIDDHAQLSMQEAENYRKEMEDLLEKYSQNIELVKSDNTLNTEEKTKMLEEVCGRFNQLADETADKYDISHNDTKNIVAETIEHTDEEIEEEIEENNDEPEAFEVPGKRTKEF